jgi:hypothetical protein
MYQEDVRRGFNYNREWDRDMGGGTLELLGNAGLIGKFSQLMGYDLNHGKPLNRPGTRWRSPTGVPLYYFVDKFRGTWVREPQNEGRHLRGYPHTIMGWLRAKRFQYIVRKCWLHNFLKNFEIGFFGDGHTYYKDYLGWWSPDYRGHKTHFHWE